MMNLKETLPEVRIQDKEGKWHQCKPFVATVKGGKAVIYVNAEGTEIKREPLARYLAREARQKAANLSESNSVATEIVEEIVQDIKGRYGLKSEWESIDTEMQEKSKAAWVDIIKSRITE